jgi:hypothetical protein
MSYGTQNVTPINMLPELEDLERGGGEFGGGNPHQQGGAYATSATYSGATMLPPGEAEKFGRYIRGSHETPLESGMTKYNQAPPQQMGPVEQYGTPIGQMSNVKTFDMPENSPTCLQFHEHFANCPICNKFYNNDKTIYIIAIIVLSIVCILLLKRVLDV